MTARTIRKQLRSMITGDTVWLADAHTWEIGRDERGYVVIDWRPSHGTYASTYRVDARYLATTRRYLELSRTHQVPVPAYVCRAILDHCAEVVTR